MANVAFLPITSTRIAVSSNPEKMAENRIEQNRSNAYKLEQNRIECVINFA